MFSGLSEVFPSFDNFEGRRVVGITRSFACRYVAFICTSMSCNRIRTSISSYLDINEVRCKLLCYLSSQKNGSPLYNSLDLSPLPHMIGCLSFPVQGCYSICLHFLSRIRPQSSSKTILIYSFPNPTSYFNCERVQTFRNAI